ncbi:hypothetical protein, partial [Lacticaseibacillus pantheris]|uniref:hypothetical protein n=1 Tax=Lacticaseibacillus pantheris TaxID=171523 RepID=UPI001CDAEB27
GNLDILASVVVSVNTFFSNDYSMFCINEMSIRCSGVALAVRPEQHKISYQPPRPASSTLCDLFELLFKYERE